MINKKYFNQSGNAYLKLILIFVGLILAIFTVFFIIQFAQKKKTASEVIKENLPLATTTVQDDIFVLPLIDEENNQQSSSTAQSIEAAEKYYPGDFYKTPATSRNFFSDYSLPLNAKTDVANYYDFSRKINLDKSLASLNSSGFAIIDNSFSDVKNFYKAYEALDNIQVPPLLTADFLTYYYQNITKLAYKKIESAVFYNILWKTNKELYEKAKTRYEQKKTESGLANDLALEAARRELVFLAVSLSLLQPQEKQVAGVSGLDGNGKFSLNEAEEFSFDLPNYLSDDVSSELSLIMAGKSKVKSPVLLYEVDYSGFIIPSEYKTNERLKNFYLSSRWLNSVWPVYFKNENCPNCLLDKEDWRVSFYASLLLAGDLSSSQDLKNQWAQVYKIESFFAGLRSDLNYLHYRSALSNVFGDDKKVAENFDGGISYENLDLLAAEIAKIELPLIEGGRDKNSLVDKPYIGLKMLAESQWPNNFIFNKLTGTSTGLYLGTPNEAIKVATACLENRKYKRCLPSALDIVNLSVDGKVSNSYIISNVNYEFYSDKLNFLKKELADFTPASWHNNNFWLNLDIIKKSFSASSLSRPIFARSEEYRERDLSRLQASWVNFQLPPDEFVLNNDSSSRLSDTVKENGLISYAYIEPDQVLLGELLANTGMMIDFLTALKIGNLSGAALYDLRNLKDNLSKAEMIVKKEVAGESLTEEDYKVISNLYHEFVVVKDGEKTLDISGAFSEQKMREDLSGVKFLLVIYNRAGEKIITAGPIFNYREARKK